MFHFPCPPSPAVAEAEGSSTESMSHMHQARGGNSSSVEGYTDKVIDQQYVLIEASPPSHSPQGSEVSCQLHCNMLSYLTHERNVSYHYFYYLLVHIIALILCFNTAYISDTV